jgi:hypothetical protein
VERIDEAVTWPPGKFIAHVCVSHDRWRSFARLLLPSIAFASDVYTSPASRSEETEREARVRGYFGQYFVLCCGCFLHSEFHGVVPVLGWLRTLWQKRGYNSMFLLYRVFPHPCYFVQGLRSGWRARSGGR